MNINQTVSPLHPNFSPRQTTRNFTLDRARRALPLVRRITADIVSQHRLICELEDRCHESNDASFEADLRDHYAAALDRLRDLIDELSDIGCELRDWRRGIVDFPAFQDGHRFEFCWHLGEPDISHWHEPDASFCGRRKIDDSRSPRQLTA